MLHKVQNIRICMVKKIIIIIITIIVTVTYDCESIEIKIG